MASTTDRDAPDLVRLLPSERHKLPVKQIIKSLHEEEKPAEFAIEVMFTKSFPEPAVLAAYEALFKSTDDEDLAKLVHVDGVTEKGDQVPLFVDDGSDDDDDDHDDDHDHSKKARSSKQKAVSDPAASGPVAAAPIAKKEADKKPTKKRKTRKFREVCVWLETISPAVTGRTYESDDDDDGWVDDDGEASAEEDEAANAADEAKESGDDYFLPEIVRVQTIETLVRLVKKCTDALDKKAMVELSSEPTAAVTRAEQMATLVYECDTSIRVRLRCDKPSGFAAADAWDVLLALSMNYDPKCRDFNMDDDDAQIHLFSAKPQMKQPSSLEQFDPAELSTIALDEIVFSCFVPLSPAGTVLKLMLPAATYAQTRLGGTLLNDEGGPLKLRELKQDVEFTEKRVRACGLIPGGNVCASVYA